MIQRQLVFGFHGCEEDVRDKILNSDNEHLDKSSNSYDWLGNGIYFWLNDPMRAYEWAEQKKKSIVYYWGRRGGGETADTLSSGGSAHKA